MYKPGGDMLVLGLIDYKDVMNYNTNLKELQLLIIGTLDLFPFYNVIEDIICEKMGIHRTDDEKRIRLKQVYLVLEE